MNQKTTIEALNDLAKALRECRMLFFESLYIPQMTDWLEKKLERIVK